MARGTKKAKIHDVFKDRLKELQTRDADAIAGSIKASAQRLWQVPEKLHDTKLTDVPKLHTDAWDRAKINENYVDCMTGVDAAAGTVGDVISLKTQIDYNAIEERAFRMRHATITRSIIMQHGRRDGHAKSNLFPFVLQQANNCILQGAQPAPSTASDAGDAGSQIA